MSEHPTPRTVEDAAVVESQRRYPSGPDNFVPWHLADQRIAFAEGAAWQAAQAPTVDAVPAAVVAALVDAAVEVAADDTPLLAAVQAARTYLHGTGQEGR